MALTYNHRCLECDTPFEAQDREQQLCLFCGEGGGDANYVQDPTIKGVDYPSGENLHYVNSMTKDKEIMGEDQHLMVRPERKCRFGSTQRNRPAAYKRKPCALCHKKFKPEAPNNKICPACKEGGLKEIRVGIVDFEHAQRIQHKNNEYNRKQLEDQATALIEAAKPPTPMEIKNDIKLIVDEKSRKPGKSAIVELKKIPLTVEIPGLWAQQEVGQTFDGRPFSISKNFFSGQIIMQLSEPTEIYMSDSTNHA